MRLVCLRGLCGFGGVRGGRACKASVRLGRDSEWRLGQVLWFLRNPADPEEHPFRDLVDEPLAKHTRRLVLSLLLYAPLTMLLVHVPVLLIRAALPSLLPLRSVPRRPAPTRPPDAS